MIKVSVLTPVYNSEQFLPQCLESLCSQTLEDVEFICVNDGSTDNSLQILESFASTDKRIRLIDKPNTGYGDSMNRALESAKGEYIGIVESDDYAEPSMFEDLYKIATSSNSDIAGSNRFLFNDEHDTFDEVMKGLPYNEILCPLSLQEVFKPAPCIWAKIYNRQFLEDNNIKFLETPGSAFQDTGFVYKSMIASKRMVLTKSAYLHYRTDNSEKSVKSSSNALAIFKEFSSIDAFLNERTADKGKFTYYSKLRWQAYRWNYNRLDEASKKLVAPLMSKDLKVAKKIGFFDLKEFNKHQAKNIKLLLASPKLWHLVSR